MYIQPQFRGVLVNLDKPPVSLENEINNSVVHVVNDLYNHFKKNKATLVHRLLARIQCVRINWVCPQNVNISTPTSKRKSLREQAGTANDPTVYVYNKVVWGAGHLSWHQSRNYTTNPKELVPFRTTAQTLNETSKHRKGHLIIKIIEEPSQLAIIIASLQMLACTTLRITSAKRFHLRKSANQEHHS
ncbi:hypothetical protein OUZ56_002343 [Daphnia magna]|uniref:Uncharacterized protein n=1 Tax=Daphnia magna TaxID=35525 RepID=A0ABR0A5D6_9CRUS|nr:hypothetical protein OUZ56_002343 [Daphnia magna]